MHVVLVEPPKDFWFIMGKYIPPPFGILCLAAHLEEKYPSNEITVIDSQAEGLDWDKLEKKISRIDPDIIAPSSLSTANAFYALRTAELAKKLNPEVKTILGGQHFTALSEDTLQNYPEIDFIIRGEGEETFSELVNRIDKDKSMSELKGLSYKLEDKIVHNPDRPLISDLNSIPYPAYHHVSEHMKDYYFSLMADQDRPFAIVEGSRGCKHKCSYCSQWCFWDNKQRSKSPTRILEEFKLLYDKYGSKFFWFTDDNFGLGHRTREICEKIIEEGLGEEIQWFCQIRVDDIVNNPETLNLMSKAGCTWALVGFDNPSQGILRDYRRTNLNKQENREAVKILREKGIFSQGTFIIGHKEDNHESINDVREYADFLDPDIASFFVLTPFPGTDIFNEAVREGWIEDYNWANYDMVHAVMPTKHLSIKDVQKELYDCYNHFFGSWPRRYRGISSRNPITRRTYTYLAKQALITELKGLV
ncbi:radical SAM protein [Candidatus Bathyarchaeota archaeon]|nr:radical SAM protein [Candidatus Bathyarchaeota archaeon]